MRIQTAYLTDILEQIRRLELIAAEGKAAFFGSVLLQDAMARNFEVIGEAVKHLSKDVTNRRPDIDWKSIAGFRDVLIHNYARIDLEVVWATCTEQIVPLKGAIEALVATLDKSKNAE